MRRLFCLVILVAGVVLFVGPAALARKSLIKKEAATVSVSKSFEVGTRDPKYPVWPLLDGRDIEVRLCDADLIIFLNRLFHPRIERGGDRQLGLKSSVESLQLLGCAADDGAQRRELAIQIVLGRNLLGHDLIVLRLGVVGVGDRRRANFEVALGLRQILAHRCLLAFGQLDVEPRQQHVEVCLYHADDEILLR